MCFAYTYSLFSCWSLSSYSAQYCESLTLAELFQAPCTQDAFTEDWLQEKGEGLSQHTAPWGFRMHPWKWLHLLRIPSSLQRGSRTHWWPSLMGTGDTSSFPWSFRLGEGRLVASRFVDLCFASHHCLFDFSALSTPLNEFPVINSFYRTTWCEICFLD